MPQLAQCKLFSGLSASELAQLERCAQTRTFPPEGIVFQEGDEGDGVYFVGEGSLEVSAMINEKERRVLSKLAPGDFFGEMAVLDNNPRSATVTAKDAVLLYFMPREAMLGLLEASPRVALELVREFSRKLREFNRQYIEEVLQAERLALVGRFARSIVHDFKNPLNVIGIAAELAGMGNAAPEVRKKALGRIRKQVDRLNNMIGELLEFTRGANTQAVLARSHYGRFLQRVLEDLESEMTDRSVGLELENPLPEVELHMDPNRLTHVIHNLVHNAIQAMPGGGIIRLRTWEEGREFITEIEDTGKGLAPEILPRLFEPFATYGKSNGTGLGLSICRKVVEDHGGWIRARNEPGRGAIFSFSLPLSR